jgi:hypothetical protein
MSPESLPHSGGTVGHAAPGTANRRGAACADDLQVLAHSTAVVCFALCVLVLGAPTLWPNLFAH